MVLSEVLVFVEFSQWSYLKSWYLLILVSGHYLESWYFVDFSQWSYLESWYFVDFSQWLLSGVLVFC